MFDRTFVRYEMADWTFDRTDSGHPAVLSSVWVRCFASKAALSEPIWYV
ncbi:hypothetical protein [Haloarcula marina]|nr:hypothetical protein [Halomicroarcula marina]